MQRYEKKVESTRTISDNYALNTTPKANKAKERPPNSCQIGTLPMVYGHKPRLRLLDERDATLDKLREVLTLEHAVRQQCEVDNLAHLIISLAYLLKACVALGA